MPILTAGLLTATPEPNHSPPRVRLDVAVPSGVTPTFVTVKRLDPNGELVPVRNASPAGVGGESWVGYDYEAPFGAEVRYEAVLEVELVDSLSGQSSWVTLDVPLPWLIHVGQPAFSIPLPTIRSEGNRRRPVSAGTFDVVGRKRPVVKTDGVRKAPATSLVLFTETMQQLDALLLILDDASVLLLNLPLAWNVGITAEYISVGDVEESRFVTVPGDEFQPRDVTLTYQVVDRPEGDSQAGRTYADLLDEASTYEELAALYGSYAELLAPTF